MMQALQKLLPLYWLYEDIISGITGVVDLSSYETIDLISGKTIVHNSDVLAYTRDKEGEYRVSDLLEVYTIRFKGTLYTEAFNFYRVPKEVQENSYKQFDPEVIKKPFFQDNVEKVLETRDGLPVGPMLLS